MTKTLIIESGLGGAPMNRTQKAIIDAFWQLLEEKPYNKITVQSIVERCQVNRNTVYYHFQDIPSLTEHSIKDWTERVIKNNCEFGAPIQCITLVVQEFIRRKSAFIHLYRSSHKEGFIRCMNEISQYIVQSYVDKTTEGMSIAAEDKAAFIRYYKCTIAGVALDWLDSGASYDLSAFCKKICNSFEGSGKRAFLKLMQGA